MAAVVIIMITGSIAGTLITDIIFITNINIDGTMTGTVTIGVNIWQE